MVLLYLCLKIFFVRIIDVSLGTFVTMLTVKGHSLWASILGFIDILLWFVIVKEAINTSETSIFVALSYAGGFATGTFIGTVLSEKYIKGKLSVQVITNKDANKLADILRTNGFAVSIMNVIGHNEKEEKNMLFLEIDNTKLTKVKTIIKKIDKKAFIVVNETKYVQNGFFTK